MILLAEETLANGLQLSYYDDSRVLAGDRWLVALVCRGGCPLPEDFAERVIEEEPELRAAILEQLGKSLQLTVKRTRHFVDQQDKEEVLIQLLAGVKGQMLTYFAKPGFPERLFSETCRQLREECQLAIRRGQVPPETADEEGPTDFSALFR